MERKTNAEWVALMQRVGREVHTGDSLPFSCLLFDKGKIVSAGVSTKSVDEAITHCRNRYALNNIKHFIEKAELSAQQKANVKAAKKLVQKSES